MPGRRMERLNEQFRRELTEILRGEAKDPRVTGLTLTSVRVASDLSFARVFVAPLPEQQANDEALTGLRAASPFLRRELGARMHVRRVPELRFEIDESLEHARRIEQLLHDVSVSGTQAQAAERSGAEGDATSDDPGAPDVPGAGHATTDDE